MTAHPTDSAAHLLYIGTYTEPPNGRAQGAYIYRFDGASGELTHVQTVAAGKNPSFLVQHPTQPYMYAVNEYGQGDVSAFAVAPDGTLTMLNHQPAHGDDPCHLSIDPSGMYVMIANYSSGNFAVYPVEAGGRLGVASDIVQHTGSGPNTARQGGARAHFIAPDPAGTHIVVEDLGIDRTMVYTLDAGKLVPHDPPGIAAHPGAGPRHLAFHPNGRYAYVNNELDSTVTAYTYDGTRGVFAEVGTHTTLPAAFAGNNSTAEIAVHPNGRFVYVSNRGHHSIAIFAVDATTGDLTAIGHESTRGETPRSFALDPSGAWLLAANQNTDTVAVFRVNTDTGALTPTGEPVAVPSPVCLLFGR